MVKCNMKKLWAVALSACMAASTFLAGCGSEQTGGAASEAGTGTVGEADTAAQETVPAKEAAEAGKF